MIPKLFAALALVASLAAAPVLAQDYPNRQVSAVISAGPGAGTDIIGRFLADRLQKLWGQNVVPENRAGAGSVIALSYVARSKPDGYTLLLGSGTVTANAAIQKNLPVDPIKDLLPVALTASGTYALVVGPNVKANNLEDFIKEAKGRKMLYAAAGIGSLPHFAMELFNMKTGLEMTPVHYKSGADMVVDLLGGRVDTFIAGLTTSMPSVESGKARALAVAGAARVPELPNTPTLDERGVKGAEVTNWFGVFVPANTPDDIVRKIHAGVSEVLSTPDAAEFFRKNGLTWQAMSTKDFQTMVINEYNNWRKIAVDRGLEKN